MNNKPSDMSFNSMEDAETARKFFKLWQKGEPPDLAQFVHSAGPLTPVRLAAVVCVDLRERWKRQQRTKPEDYLQRFSELQSSPDAALDVVYCEFLLRDEQGEGPTAAEYAGRFPQLAAELKRQIDMHRLLQIDEQEMDSRKTLAQADSKRLRAFNKPAAAVSPASKNWPKLPGFEILDRLGRGGMGVVYKAWQEKLLRVVAIKMLQPESGDPEQAMARFHVEAEAIARLHHNNILQVYEVGDHDAQPYLVMEYADAGTLAQKTDGNPWPAKAAAQMVETLARAVHYAHQRGVLHRDLTPGNVLLLADGTPKLSDFGLAKLIVGGSTLTQTGAIVGTPSYMSPEQASGSSHEVGPTVDVYALGAILFELLTGRPPFKAATPLETLALVVHAEPVAPRQLQPSVPRDLETICIKCLRKEPTRRYLSAADLADDLKAFLSGDAIRARPIGNLERVWRWGRRNKGWATALVVVLLSLVGSFAAAVALTILWQSEKNALLAERKALLDQRKAERETQRKLYDSMVNEARAERLKGQVGQRYHSLELLDKAKDLAEKLQLKHVRFQELRDEFIACLALPDLQLVREWDGFPPATYGLDFDENMTLYARGDMRGNVSVRRIEDDSQIASIPGEGAPVQLRFSVGATFLAIAAGDRLRLWERTAKQTIDMPPAHSFSFGMQGRQLATLGKDGRTIVVLDLPSRKEVQRETLDFSIQKLECHPSLPVLALASGRDVLLYDLAGKQVLETIRHPENVICLDWAENGKVLATGCADKFLRVYELTSTQRKQMLTDPAQLRGHRLLSKVAAHAVQGLEVMLNRDGTILASTNWFNNLRLWEAHSGQPLFMPLAEGGLLRFSARDDLLACTAPEGKLRLYRAVAAREFQRLPEFDRFQLASPRQVVFQPSGRLLFAADENGLASIDTSEIEVEPLALGNWAIPVGFDAHGSLITQAQKSYQLWPASATESGRSIRYGPPRVLAEGPKTMRVREMRTAIGPAPSNAGDEAGPILALPDLDDGALLVLPATRERPAKTIRLGPQKDVRYCAISADGRFVATGAHDAPNQPAAVVWDAKTGARLHEIPALPRLCEVGFSPDSRWLITTGGGCKLWSTADWQPGPAPGGSAFAFAPGDSMLAVEGDKGQVRLVDPATGTDFARLTAPSELHSLPACFSPDGSMLVVYGSEMQGLFVWDLRAVRQALHEKKLDWNLPAFPPPSTGPIMVEMAR